MASSSRSGESVVAAEDVNQQPAVELATLAVMVAALVIDLSFRRCSWNRRQ